VFFKTRNHSRTRPATRPSARTVGLLAVAGVAALALPVVNALAAQPSVGLGGAESFGILAGSTVTNTGPSTIYGDLGLGPGTAVAGFPPGTVNGTIHKADGVAGNAKVDLTTAYVDAAGRTPPLAVSGDLGGLTVTGGVYKSKSSLGLTGVLTLDAQGDPSTVFIFQAGSTLTTASGSHVKLINGAQACNVFWQVGSSAMLGTTSVFDGNIVALTSISMNRGVVLNGRALARNGAVTLIDDTITADHCAAGTGGTGGGGTGGAPATGTAVLTTAPAAVARQIARFGTSVCVKGDFRATVRGLLIRRVVFSLGTRVIARIGTAPFAVLVKPTAGIRTVTARVTFTNSTPAATLRLRFRTCAKAVVSASGFTG
jgi:hypothetical protein